MAPVTKAISVILASASPARLKTLRNAGVDPIVIISDVDERALVAVAIEELGPQSPADQALLLARAKAEAVASTIEQPVEPAIIIGCDSVFEFEGEPYGRPASAAQAFDRIKAMQGNSGVLQTGHWVIALPSRPPVIEPDEATTQGNAGFDTLTTFASHPAGNSGGVGSTTVNFGTMSDDEIQAYVDTGEPLKVAGSFTVDSLGGPYIESIEGDYHNVVGISLPLVRRLLAELSIPWHALRVLPPSVE
jgi:septum formation protein